MSCCKWTQPLGKPVLPELYSQKALSFLLVSAASRFVDAFCVHLSKSCTVGVRVCESLPGSPACPPDRVPTRDAVWAPTRDAPTFSCSGPTTTTCRRYLSCGRICCTCCHSAAWIIRAWARLSLSIYT